MIDIDAFPTILYVMADDLCKSHFLVERRPCLSASLSRSEKEHLLPVERFP